MCKNSSFDLWNSLGTSTLFSKSSYVPMELHRKDLCYVGRVIPEHVGTSVDMFHDEIERNFVGGHENSMAANKIARILNKVFQSIVIIIKTFD